MLRRMVRSVPRQVVPPPRFSYSTESEGFRLVRLAGRQPQLRIRQSSGAIGVFADFDRHGGGHAGTRAKKPITFASTLKCAGLAEARRPSRYRLPLGNDKR